MKISEQKIRSILKQVIQAQTQSRPIYEIAEEIASCWRNPAVPALPYLEAMLELSSVKDMYGADDAESVILYFLSNATGWRGPDAQRLKAELKAALKAI